MNALGNLSDSELGLLIAQDSRPALYTKVGGTLEPVNGKEMTPTEVEQVVDQCEIPDYARM